MYGLWSSNVMTFGMELDSTRKYKSMIRLKDNNGSKKKTVRNILQGKSTLLEARELG